MFSCLNVKQTKSRKRTVIGVISPTSRGVIGTLLNLYLVLGPTLYGLWTSTCICSQKISFGYQDMNMSCFVMNYQQENERKHFEEQWTKHWVLGSRTRLILCTIPSRELTYPVFKALLKMIFLFPRWDMLIPWRVYIYIYIYICLNLNQSRAPKFNSTQHMWIAQLFRRFCQAAGTHWSICVNLHTFTHLNYSVLLGK